MEQQHPRAMHITRLNYLGIRNVRGQPTVTKGTKHKTVRAQIHRANGQTQATVQRIIIAHQKPGKKYRVQMTNMVTKGSLKRQVQHHQPSVITTMIRTVDSNMVRLGPDASIRLYHLSMIIAVCQKFILASVDIGMTAVWNVHQHPVVHTVQMVM